MMKPMMLFSFRIPRDLARRLRAVARLYKAEPSTFLRDMIEATCSGDQGKTIVFLQRVQEGLTRQRQLDLFAEARSVNSKPARKGGKGLDR